MLLILIWQSVWLSSEDLHNLQTFGVYGLPSDTSKRVNIGWQGYLMLEVAGLRSTQGTSRHVRCMGSWKMYGRILKSRSVDFNRILHPKYSEPLNFTQVLQTISSIKTFVIFPQQAEVVTLTISFSYTPRLIYTFLNIDRKHFTIVFTFSRNWE